MQYRIQSSGSVQRLIFLFLFALLISLITGCGLHTSAKNETPQIPCISHGWPQDTSDLSADPELIFGTLDNGLRYVIKQNHEPRGRIALYLDIQAGSLNETEEQRGLAHYLEHMVFNGTAHFPPGTLIKYFQSIGMGFGADTNAHTSYDETVYKLLLPGTDDKTLNDGMLVLADYARRALLLELEVNRERGVILAEKRSRDSAGSRISKNLLKHEFAGTRVAMRDPIGTEQTLLAADSGRLRSFYDAWYRPENMIVVLVGDITPDRAKERIDRFFSELQAGKEVPACFDFGRVREAGTDIFYQYEADLGLTNIGISAVWNVQPQADTMEREKIQLQNYAAAVLLNNRLQHAVNKENSPFSEAQAYSGTFVQRLGYFVLRARTNAETWQQGLSLLEHTLRQAVIHGVTAAELERVKREINAELDQAVQTADSRDSSTLASDIIRKINGNEVVLSPLQEQRFYGAMLARMSVADIKEALQRMWLHSRHVVEVAGTADLRAADSAPEQQVLRVWSSAAAAPVQAWQQEESIKFPYLTPPRDHGTVAQVVSHPAIKATTTILADGLRINVKKTDFKDRQVLLGVHFGNGRLSEPVAGLGQLAEAVIKESGVGKLNREQLDAALAGRNGRVDFSVGSESFVFSGKGLTSELELMLQLVYTTLTDPAFRPEAYSRSMERFRQMYKAMRGSVEGTLRLTGDRFFAGGNSRYGLPSEEDFMGLTLEQVRQWLSRAFKNDQLEISVVGDVDPEQVVSLVRKYFGSRKGRYEPVKIQSPVVFPCGREKIIAVDTQVEKAMLEVGWPTDDFWNIARTRRLSVLASLFEDRLRRTIREELGATYSPAAYNAASRVDSGYGVLRCLLTVDPKQVALVRDKIRSIVRELAGQGVTAGELKRALAPVITAVKDLQRTNRYWLESVLALSSRHPGQLEWPLTIRTDFASITRKEMNDFAVKYLQEKKSATLVVRSKEK
jgi:zinc protease